jgi:hypothetical protein
LKETRQTGSKIEFTVDYARTVGMAGVEQKNDALLKNAIDRFERIYQKAPQNTKNLQNWAMTLFGRGRYSDAWEKIEIAEARPDKNQLDPFFCNSTVANAASEKTDKVARRSCASAPGSAEISDPPSFTNPKG